MDIYDFKSFQEKVARFSVSPYAEAITTLAGLSPQVVSIASRLASSYASLRGTVQLLTTDEDNKIIDETTEAREVIARSAIVSAWNSMGSAVERLVSLRRNLAGEGVTKTFPRTPVDYTRGESYAGKLFPCIVPKSTNMHDEGFSIILPDGWEKHAPVGPGYRYLTLPLVASNPLISRVVTGNPVPGELYQNGVTEHRNRGRVTVGSDKPLLFVLKMPTAGNTIQQLFYMTMNIVNSQVVYVWKKLSGGAPTYYGHDEGYVEVSLSAFPTTAANSTEISEIAQYIGQQSASSGAETWCLEKTQVYFPAASDQVETFDPLDPYEVFTQAYQAADAVLSLMEEMGYSSGLSQEDRALLSSNA